MSFSEQMPMTEDETRDAVEKVWTNTPRAGVSPDPRPWPKTGKDVFIPLQTSDFKTVEKLTEERGSVYGHPLDDFGRAAKLKEVVSVIQDPILRHAAEMVCVKLARLCQSPEHLDSWDDVGGYAKTARMVIEERKRRSSPGYTGIKISPKVGSW